MDVLTLTCWIRSQNPEATFQVEVPKTETIHDLQDAIKCKEPMAFHDVDAYHLRKFNLLAHGKFLEGVLELSDVFPESPSKHDDIHVIVDAPTITCWLRGGTLESGFQVKLQKVNTVYDLKKAIKNKESVALRDMDARTLRLFKISGDEDQLRKSLHRMGDGEPLQGVALVAPKFLGAPVLDPLFVVAEASVTGGGRLTLVRQPSSGGDRLQDCEDISLKVKNWGKFEQSDIQRNRIEKAQDRDIPNFVTTFERKLVRKPRLRVNPPELHTLDAPRTYFGRSEDSIAEDGSQEEVRSASVLEVMHTAYHVASCEWQRCWKPDGGCRRPLREHVMDLIFFGVPLMTENRTAVALRDKDWHITAVVKRDNDKELRQFRPRSVFSIENSTFPRLLVEVNSTSEYSYPSDLIRMLTTGAFVVRFANKFVSTFRGRNFVLCAVFIWNDGLANRYTLFQKQDDETVYYNEVECTLNDPHGRVEFARCIYNLLSVELDRDQDSTLRGATRELRSRINGLRLKSFYAKNPTSDSPPADSSDDDDSDADGGGGDDHAQLRAHGCEVEPKVFVDESGGVWSSLCQTSDHIFNVYRPRNPPKMFIAKKIRRKSNELKIFRLLDTFPLKSNHVISLVDSFKGWAILPKMTTVQDVVGGRACSDGFGHKVSQVCLGLIEGVAYLHAHRIAHRDIKPDNLVTDKDYSLKIIDFGIAMRVENEEEEVDDRCGTDGWTAPEVEAGRHSPIRADRWGCGRVIQYLLDAFRKKDEPLRVFARDLMARDPRKRPSVVEWGTRYSGGTFSGVGNMGNSDARHPKKQRLE